MFQKEIFTIESQTEQPSTELQETQTDDVSFAGDVPTTDQITQSESAQVFDSETQYVCLKMFQTCFLTIQISGFIHRRKGRPGNANLI